MTVSFVVGFFFQQVECDYEQMYSLIFPLYVSD